MGGQRCKTCRHPLLLEIHRLRAGGTSFPDLAAEFGLNGPSIWRHFENPKCQARFEAMECAPEATQSVAVVAGQVEASSHPAPSLAPPGRRRAIAGGSRPVQPVAPDNDPGKSVAASIMPFSVLPAAPVVQPRKSLIHTDAAELSLLASLGCTDQKLADLVGCGASDVAEIIGVNRGNEHALFDATNRQWAKIFIRNAFEELIGLRRRRQDALDGKRWREAERFDPKIAKAYNDLFLTLQRFGLVGPIPPEELSKRGRDAHEIWDIIRGIAQGRMPPELTAEEELRFQEQEQSAIA